MSIGLSNHAFSEQTQGLGTFLTPNTLPRSNLGGETPHCSTRSSRLASVQPQSPAHLSLERVPICERISWYLLYIIQHPPHLSHSLSSTSLSLPSFTVSAGHCSNPLPPDNPVHGQILLTSEPPPACIHRRPTPTVIPTLLAYSNCSPVSQILPPCLTPQAVPPPS